MARFKVGVQLAPQHCTIDELRAAWQEAERMGVDSIWTWDHFFPLSGPTDGPHYEGWSILAAMAVTTERAQFGMLVTCNGYRNPDLLADMARTVDQLSGGRLILGLGAGWNQRDYTEYGYEFGTGPSRLKLFGESLPRIQERLAKLDPGPAGPLPILIGGGGEKVTLRLVAKHAQMWNGFGDPVAFAHKNAVLDEWCAKLGRDPQEIERTVMIRAEQLENVEALVDAGAQHIMLGVTAPFDFAPLQRLLDAAN